MIADASLSVDGRRVITAGRNGIAFVWDIASGRQVVELREVDQGTSAVGQGELPPAKLDEGHEFLVSNAIFFPRSDPRLLTSAGDGTVRLWNYRTGGQLSSFTGTGSNAVMTLSDDGRWLLTGGRDSEAQLWDVENDQEPLATLGGHRLEVTALAISHGGELSERTILTADASGLGKLWRWSAQDERWECFRELTAHLSGEPITAAAFLPDNRRLLTASQDFAVLQWELPTGKLIENVSLAHPGGVRAMDVSSDGRRVVTVCSVPESGTNRSTSGNRYQLSLWDAPNAVQLVRQVRTAEMVTSIALSRDARSALVVEADRGASGQVFRWEFDSNRYDRLWNDRVRLGAVWTAAESREPGYVVTVGGSHARLWRDDGELAQSFSRHGPLNAAAFSPSGTLAVTADIYGTVKIWNVDQLNSSASVAWTKPTAHGKARSPHAVNSAVFGPRPIDGDRVLLTAGDDNTARLWRIGDDGLAQLSTLSDHAGAVQQAVFSRDGKRIATASSDGTVMIWDASNPEMVTRERVLRSGGAGSLGLTCIRFSPDGKRVVIGSEDNMAEIWEVQNPLPPMLLKGHTASLTSVAFSPDGRRVVSGSSDGVARVWDASSGKSMLSLNRHKAPVTAVEFSSDGDRILTASNDTTAIIWFAYPISPTILLNEAPLVYPSEDVELGQPMPVDADLQLVDPDTPHYGGWTLSIQVQTPPADGESLSIEGSRMGIRISEHTVHYEVGGNENPIGTVQAGTGDDHLAVALTDNATLAAVEALLRSIAYTSTVPLAGDRQIQFEIVPNDEHGDEKRSNSAQRGISPAPIADMTEDEGTGET
jgi:WD40 repeat protein